MRIPERMIEFRVKPYMQEASVQIMVDTLFVALILGTLYGIGCSLIVYLGVFLLYCAVTLTLHYRVAIQALIDKRKGDHITEILSIGQFRKELSFWNNRQGESYAHLFYSRDLEMSRYKIRAIDQHGEKKKLRSIMSSQRLSKLAILHDEKNLQVTYLRRSKILLRVELAVELDKKTSRKKRQPIEKAIRYINSSI